MFTNRFHHLVFLFIAIGGALSAYVYTNAAEGRNKYKLRPDSYEVGQKKQFITRLRLENGELLKDSQITAAQIAISSDITREVELISPSVIKQVFISQITRTTVTGKGEPHTDLTYGPFHGKTMLIEFDRGHRKISFIGEPPKMRKLDAEFVYANEDEFYPSGNVELGQEWSINGEKLVMLYGVTDAIDVEGEAIFSFKKTINYRNELCAFIEYYVSMKIDFLTEEGEQVDLSISGNGVVYRSLSAFIDIERRVQGTMKLYMPGLKMTIVGPVTVEYITSIRG